MKTRNKILTGLVLTGLLGTSLYANCNMNKKNGEMNFNKNSKSHMMKSSHKMKKGMPVLRILKNLNLTAEQRTSVKEIMMNSKKNKKSINTAFTKNSFNKNEFIKTMSEKRENMIKSKAEMIEKVYAVLDNKQKEQFKVLIDLRTEKMKQRFN
jgi:Spy/CpxP family protein refolding chaperone